MMEKYAPPLPVTGDPPYLVRFLDGTRKVYYDLTLARIAAVKHNATILVWGIRAQEWRPV